jgi:hypothetical protein
MKPGIQDVLAHWIPGFIAFARLGGAVRPG